MFPKYIFGLLYFFNLWGLCTELSGLRMSHHRYHKWTVFILGANIMYLCFAIGSIFHYFEEAHESSNLLNITNDVIKFVGATVGQLIVIIESYCKRNVQQKLWKIICELRSNFEFRDRDIRFGWYLAKFGEFFGAVFFIEYMQFSKWDFARNIYFLFGYISLVTLQHIRVFHYLFFIQLLNHQLNAVEMEMQSLADDSENGPIARDRLKRIRIRYDLVHVLSDCVNEVFAWSNVTSILNLFLLLAVDLNWSYSHVTEVLGTICSLFIFVFSACQLKNKCNAFRSMRF